jgi:sarcosine oxidase subunit beta
MTGFDEEANVAIVGGGIFGLSIAYFLAKEGVDVILVEKDRIAGGASGCNTGVLEQERLLKTGKTAEDLIKKGSREIYQKWEENGDLGYDIELRDVSSLLCFTGQHIKKMRSGVWKKRFKVWESLGLSPIKRNGWSINEPNISEDISWGMEGNYALINVLRVCHGLASMAVRYGARVLTHTTVTRIRIEAKKIRQVVTDRGRIQTQTVVNAAGAWAPKIGEMVGIAIPIIPTVGQVIVTEPTEPLTGHSIVEYQPIWFDPNKPFDSFSEDPRKRLGMSTELHYHSIDGNHLVGRCEHPLLSIPRRTKIDTDPESLKYIAQGAISLVPRIKAVNSIRYFAGLRPLCEVDRKPILGAVEGIDGFLIAGGGWHMGIDLGPMVGKLISELIREGRTSIPIEEFGFSRFKNLA